MNDRRRFLALASALVPASLISIAAQAPTPAPAGAPTPPRELARHQCLVHINSDPSDRVWRLRSGNGQVSIKVQGPFASNSVLMLRKAALESLGIGY